MTFPPATDISEMSKSYANVDVALRSAICQAIYEGVDDGDHTTDAITWTSDTEEQILIIIKELRGLGYGVTEGNSTITVTWQ